MLLLEGYISNFTRARYYFLRVEFSDFYVDQSLTGQTIAHLQTAEKVEFFNFFPFFTAFLLTTSHY
jgi:hypothetical protein